MAPLTLEILVEPRSPFRLPRFNGSDRITVRYGRELKRLLITGGAPVIVSARPERGGSYVFSASALPPEIVSGPGSEALREADEGLLDMALSRFRFALAIDEDMAPFHQRFAADPLLGPAIAASAKDRPQRRADPWEALAWAITEQLIEYRRAAAIQRRIIHRWGLSVELDLPEVESAGGRLWSVPAAAVLAAAAPAELQACDLSARRSVAMIKVAREVSRGRVDLHRAADDRRLLVIQEIGPWTLACLALRGRGEPDALLAGDLGHIKLVGALEGLGRPATVEEVERFYAPYEPYRGVAGDFLLAHHGDIVRGPGNRSRIRSAGRPVKPAA